MVALTLDLKLQDIHSKVIEIQKLVDILIESIGKKPVTPGLQREINHFNNRKKQYIEYNDTKNIQEKIKISQSLAIHGSGINNETKKEKGLSNKTLEIAKTLYEKSKKLQELIENSDLYLKPIECIKKSDDSKLKINLPTGSEKQETPEKSIKKLLLLKEQELNFNQTEQRIKKIELDAQHAIDKNRKNYENELKQIKEKEFEREELIKKSLQKNELNIIKTEQRIQKIESDAQYEIDQAHRIHTNGLWKIKEKESKIDELLGYASNKTIAGGFGDNAIKEEKTANWLRYASLGGMLITSSFVGWLLWDVTQPNFDWKQSLLRIAITFILFVPVTYLARESTKHRSKQYHYEQTALDLITIDPYSASLPENEQHKLKIKIAHRLFSAQNVPQEQEAPNSIHPIIDIVQKTPQIIAEKITKKTHNESTQSIEPTRA